MSKRSERTSPVPLISVAVSVFSIAYTMAMMSYDKDVEPNVRIGNPTFYGFIPDKQSERISVFFLMLLFSSCHIMMKVLSVALLASCYPTFLVLYFCGDILLYFVYKLLRRDFSYWVRLPTIMSAILSVVARLVMKLICDYTLFLQGR